MTEHLKLWVVTAYMRDHHLFTKCLLTEDCCIGSDSTEIADDYEPAKPTAIAYATRF